MGVSWRWKVDEALPVYATAAFGALRAVSLGNRYGGYGELNHSYWGLSQATASFEDLYTVQTGSSAPLQELFAIIHVNWDVQRPAQIWPFDSQGNPAFAGVAARTAASMAVYSVDHSRKLLGTDWAGLQSIPYIDPFPNPSGEHNYRVSLGLFTPGVAFSAGLQLQTWVEAEIAPTTNGPNYWSDATLEVLGYQVANGADGGDLPLLSLSTASGYNYTAPVPEPATWLMTALGAWVLLMRRRVRPMRAV
jgi:hypothetical protein